MGETDRQTDTNRRNRLKKEPEKRIKERVKGKRERKLIRNSGYGMTILKEVKKVGSE